MIIFKLSNQNKMIAFQPRREKIIPNAFLLQELNFQEAQEKTDEITAKFLDKGKLSFSAEMKNNGLHLKKKKLCFLVSNFN